MFYNIEICVYPVIFLKNTSFCYPGITNIWQNVRLVRDRKEATGMSPFLYGNISSEDKGISSEGNDISPERSVSPAIRRVA